MSILIIKSCRIRAFLTRIFILHQYKFVRVHHIQLVRKFFGLHISVQTNDNPSFNRTFGCHQNNTVRTACTIDGRRGRIFQHLDRFNIGRRDIVQAAHFKSVQYDKRTVILCNRTATTYQNLNFSIRRTVYSCHLHTRQFTDDGFSSRSGLYFLQYLAGYAGDRTGKITSFLRTIADYDYVVQHSNSFFHVDINVRGTSFQRFFCFFHTYIANYQHGLGYIGHASQCKFTVQIGRGTDRSALHRYCGTNHRSHVVGHRTGHSSSLCHSTHRYPQQDKYVYDYFIHHSMLLL